MSYKTNSAMFWSDDGGTTWNKVTDHNRQPLTVGINRIENANRMVNGRMRRYSIAKKQTISTSWENVPSIAVPSGGGLGTVDGGFGGLDIKNWHDSHDGSFQMRFRKGQDDGKLNTDGTIELITVMITDFSHDVVKRGLNVDLWNVSITLEEV